MTEPIDTDDAPTEGETETTPAWASWAAALVVTSIGAILLAGAWDIPERAGQPLGPRAFPLTVGVVALAVGVTLVVQLILRQRHRMVGGSPAVPGSLKRWASLGGIVVAVIAYTLLLSPLGYVLSTLAFFVAVCFLMGSRSPLRDLTIGAGIALAVYLAFNGLLGVRLPGGILDFGI